MWNISNAKRLVVKIGTNLLTADNHIDRDYIETIASQIGELRQKGKRVLLVTSGAIGMGASELNIMAPITNIKIRQVCAAVGQPLLIHCYKEAFGKLGIPVAQILLTREVLNQRKTYLNLRNSVENLLELGVLPIFNENDTISTEEIGSAFGDNDKLSALIASKVDADLLIMLTDIDALYTGDPKKSSKAQPIKVVERITPEIRTWAGKRGSTYSTGGMKTKLDAVEIAAKAGCVSVLAHGKFPNVLPGLISGEVSGTLFLAEEKRTNRDRWILNSESHGAVKIDKGALQAIRRGKSLLPSGITAVEGIFRTGEVIKINDQAKAITSLNNYELLRVLGKHSREIADVLGPGKRDVVARPEDIVFLDQ